MTQPPQDVQPKRDAVALVIARMTGDSDGAMAILNQYRHPRDTAVLLVMVADFAGSMATDVWHGLDPAVLALRKTLSDSA